MGLADRMAARRRRDREQTDSGLTDTSQDSSSRRTSKRGELRLEELSDPVAKFAAYFLMLEEKMPAKQRRHPLIYGLRRIMPTLMRDLSELPSEQVADMFRFIGMCCNMMADSDVLPQDFVARVNDAAPGFLTGAPAVAALIDQPAPAHVWDAGDSAEADDDSPDTSAPSPVPDDGLAATA